MTIMLVKRCFVCVVVAARANHVWDPRASGLRRRGHPCCQAGDSWNFLFPVLMTCAVGPPEVSDFRHKHWCFRDFRRAVSTSPFKRWGIWLGGHLPKGEIPEGFHQLLISVKIFHVIISLASRVETYVESSIPVEVCSCLTHTTACTS